MICIVVLSCNITNFEIIQAPDYAQGAVGHGKLPAPHRPAVKHTCADHRWRQADTTQKWAAPFITASKGCEMNQMIDVTIPVEPEAAAALSDSRNREAIGRLVSRVLHPRSGPSALARAIAAMKAEARAVGLSDADIDAELAAYKVERHDEQSEK
jgi:hypothetical protein